MQIFNLYITTRRRYAEDRQKWIGVMSYARKRAYRAEQHADTLKTALRDLLALHSPRIDGLLEYEDVQAIEEAARKALGSGGTDTEIYGVEVRR